VSRISSIAASYCPFFFAIILLVSLLASEATSAQQVYYINSIVVSCNTYNRPGCFPDVDEGQVIVEGPWDVEVVRHVRICNGSYQTIPYIGYTGSKCAYSFSCPSGQSWQLDGANFSCVDDECPFGDCESSSSSSSSTPICVPPYYYDPIVDDCVLDDSSSSSVGSSSSGGSSSEGSSSGGSSSSAGSSSGSGSSSPGNPVPSDSTCPNKFQIGDQWYCLTNPMPSSDGQASSDAAAAAAGTCGTPPVCDGDPVGCAILLNTHFLRCNTDKTAEGGGDCSAEPSCSGDPVGCSVVLQSWKLRCDQQGDPIDGDADVAEYDNNFNSEFSDDKKAPVDSEGALSHLADVTNTVNLNSIDWNSLNVTSTGRSAQCPDPRRISLSTGEFEVSFQPLCDLAEGLSTLVVLIFGYLGVILVWRSTQNG